VLTRGGQDQVLELEGPAGLAALPGGVPRPATSVGLSRVSDKNIQMVGENEYIVDRAEVDNAFENMSNLFTQVRAVPHFEGGRSTGFRLFAIRQGSLFDKIGLKNGDIIQRINDADLNDPSRALALMQDMRNEEELTVEVIRNRQPQTLHYRFR
jgi:general secretion pathway protein C